MAGEKRIYATKSVTIGASAVDCATHVGIQAGSVKATDPGPAGSPGMAEEVVTDRSLGVTIFGMDPDQLQGFVEAAAANVVITYIGEGGVDKTITIKSVAFNDPPGPIDVPRKDAGGQVPTMGISGRANWGSADTWALMLVYA